VYFGLLLMAVGLFLMYWGLHYFGFLQASAEAGQLSGASVSDVKEDA